MSTEIAEDIRFKMMNLLKEEEEKTDLENLAVLSRIGMKVASSTSAELDADTVSASSTALIDLGLRLTTVTNHGDLKEIILHNSSGYSILIAVNEDYLIFGGLKAMYRIGFYLGYLREVARKLNFLLSGGELTEMALSLEEKERQKLTQQAQVEEESSKFIMPSVEQDKQALGELLGFLDEWEKEGTEYEELETGIENNIVSIPKSVAAKSANASQKFKVYEDEVPPVPLEDYTPMEIEEESPETLKTPASAQAVPSTSETTPSKELPSFDELKAPEFDEASIAKEYDSDFILEEESEALGDVLKDLGWEEEE